MKLQLVVVAILATSLLSACGDPKGSCTPKTCLGEKWQCGTLDDGCGGSIDCGTCEDTKACSGAHVCDCRSESTAAFCKRLGKNCGQFTGTNLCDGERSVFCGACQVGLTCGATTANVCSPGCAPETDADFCKRVGKVCGLVGADDNCGQPRTADCGGCLLPAFCQDNFCVGVDAGQPGPDAVSAGPDAAPAGPDASPAGLDAAAGEDAGAPGLDAAEPYWPDIGSPYDYDAGVVTCAAEKSKAQQMPLDMYIMMDQSGSMDMTLPTGGTSWTAVVAALKSFLAQPMTDVSAGIQYFGLPPGTAAACFITECVTTADCAKGGAICGTCSSGYCSGYTYFTDSCSAADYARPDVAIGLLPGVKNAINASLDRHAPTTLTPTSAALQGAINYSKTWANSHAGHVVITVLATDGDPSTCDTNITNIRAIAAAGAAGTPKVLTFVIGVGTSLTNLNGIAASGGTTSALLVDTSANVNQQFLAALNKIRGAALGCTYRIPPPTTGQLDFTKVNVQYTPGSTGTPVILAQSVDAAHCGSGDAWYYDNPAAPTQIVLCASTCQKVQADSAAQVDILVGCQTHHCPPTILCNY